MVAEFVLEEQSSTLTHLRHPMASRHFMRLLRAVGEVLHLGSCILE